MIWVIPLPTVSISPRLPGHDSGELARELMYYGVSAISLVTTGSHQEGLRACTSFIQDHQYDQLDERMAIFAENHPIQSKNIPI